MRSQKGQIIYEAAISSLILIILVLGLIEILLLTFTIIDVHKIAREGAREAALTGSIVSGQQKAEDCSQQYFNGDAAALVYTNTVGGEKVNVVCAVTKPYRPVKFLDGLEVNINAEAVYPFQDENN